MKKGVIIFISLVLVIIVLWIATSRAVLYKNMLNGDFFTFWLSGWMVWQGQQPYDQSQWLANNHFFGAEWIPNPTFVYPLPLAILFAPLGSLDLLQAAKIWVLLSSLMVLASAVLLLSLWTSPTKWSFLLPTVVGFFTFRAVLIVLRTAQLGALWLLIISLVIWFWKRRCWWCGGLLLPFLMLKPSFGFLIFGLAAIWLLVDRRLGALFGMVISGLALLIIGWLIDPAWIQHYLSIGGEKLARDFGYFPTLWGFLYMFFQQNLMRTAQVGVAISILIVTMLLVIFLHWKNRLDPEKVMSLIILVSLLLTPYLWAYDHILLLLPIMISMGYLYIWRTPYLVVASFPICMSVLSLLLLFLAMKVGNDAMSVCLPLAISILMALMLSRPISSSKMEQF